MATIFVLVGVRGSGKSTLCDNLRARGWHVLKPSTTRAKRSATDDEYHFVDPAAWNQLDMAWTIALGGNLYGMSNAELLARAGQRAVTVFAPSSIDVLENYRKSSAFEFVTVGLDTVRDRVTQWSRVGQDRSRMIQTDEQLNTERESVRQCDIVLSGTEDIVLDAIIAAAITIDRGGILDERTIRTLVRAGSLLDDADSARVEPASYDLRLGDEAWINGELKNLSNQKQLVIPAYCYAVVKAREVAKLPTFVAGRFDLKVSMFVNGIILSNGPQVDPGYEGALLCLLYNANDSDYSLYPDKHFATIEFHTVVRATRAYRAQYQRARDFASFMAGSTAAGRGARLSERLTKVESDLGSYKMWFVGTFLAFIATGIAFLAYANDVASRLSDAVPAPTDQRATTPAESATPAPLDSKAPPTPAVPAGELGTAPPHTAPPTPAKDRAKAP